MVTAGSAEGYSHVRQRRYAVVRSKVTNRHGTATQVCRGCRDENGTMKWMGWTEPCSVYRCVTRKNIDFCCGCDDFPCDNLHPYADKASGRPHNTRVFKLCQVKKMRLEPVSQNVGVEGLSVSREYPLGTTVQEQAPALLH
jgi:Protein of unknown function (DUF3795)